MGYKRRIELEIFKALIMHEDTAAKYRQKDISFNKGGFQNIVLQKKSDARGWLFSSELKNNLIENLSLNVSKKYLDSRMYEFVDNQIIEHRGKNTEEGPLTYFERKTINKQELYRSTSRIDEDTKWTKKKGSFLRIKRDAKTWKKLCIIFMDNNLMDYFFYSTYFGETLNTFGRNILAEFRNLFLESEYDNKGLWGESYDGRDLAKAYPEIFRVYLNSVKLAKKYILDATSFADIDISSAKRRIKFFIDAGNLFQYLRAEKNKYLEKKSVGVIPKDKSAQGEI